MSRLDTLKSMTTIGYWSALGGVEVKEIAEEGYETYVSCISNAWNGKKQAHKVKIKYTKGGAGFIELHGTRLKMNECLHNEARLLNYGNIR